MENLFQKKYTEPSMEFQLFSATDDVLSISDDDNDVVDPFDN